MVIQGHEYREQGISQGQKNEKLIAIRGNIFDRKDVALTQNIIHYSLGAQTLKIKDKALFADKISNVTGRDVGYYINKLNTKKSFVPLEHKLRQSIKIWS